MRDQARKLVPLYNFSVDNLVPYMDFGPVPKYGIARVEGPKLNKRAGGLDVLFSVGLLLRDI